MFDYGFIKIACAIPLTKIADPQGNLETHISMIKIAEKEEASLLLFPELSLTSYTCGDLFLSSQLISETLKALKELINFSKDLNLLIIVGCPIPNKGKIYNCACVINKGRLLGIVPKSHLPNYKEFYELRWFTSGKDIKNQFLSINGEEIHFGTDLIFTMKDTPKVSIGIEICEDLWSINPPSSLYAQAGATILLNLSASNALVTKNEYRKLLVKTQSAKTISAYAYCNAGVMESTTDMVFDGSSFIYENGIELSASEPFKSENQIIFADIDFEFLSYERSRLNTFQNNEIPLREIHFEGKRDFKKFIRKIDPHPFIPKEKEKLKERTREILNIQVTGLARRFEHLKGSKAVIGLSGGLDSTLSFLVTIETFEKLGRPKTDILPITMPGPGTSETTFENVKRLTEIFGTRLEIIPISEVCKLVLEYIKHPIEERDVVFENVQSRARTYFLMMKANQVGGIVVGTSDLSEIALGFATYNGDHISMYNVNSSIPKTLVRFIIKEKADELGGEAKKILYKILNQPISPELLPPENGKIVQKTEEKIGPYELHDFFLYNFVRMGFSIEKIRFLATMAFEKTYTKREINRWLKVFVERFIKNQWKRDCIPGGPKVGSVDLSPRSSWRMPSEINPAIFFES